MVLIIKGLKSGRASASDRRQKGALRKA